MAYLIHPTDLPDVLRITPDVYTDTRGAFCVSYRAKTFQQQIPEPFIQDNCVYSKARVLRGLHYQEAPYAQGKLVTAVHGEIFDVAVDLRPDSPTFREWIGVTLSDYAGTLLYLPPGFAHGYCVLSQDAVVLYKVTAEYCFPAERGIRWDDPALKITWPIATPILSEKDAFWPWLEPL
jgi:dTDP-4-dehydrorhamnose 3,5-epimerase